MDELLPGPDSGREDGLIWGAVSPGDSGRAGVFGGTVIGASGDAHENLWWYADGTVWDLGAAELDADGDGVADSLTSELDGDHVVLSDYDGDGRVDRMSQMHIDGRVTERSVDGVAPEWSPTRLGRLD